MVVTQRLNVRLYSIVIFELKIVSNNKVNISKLQMPTRIMMMMMTATATTATLLT